MFSMSMFDFSTIASDENSNNNSINNNSNSSSDSSDSNSNSESSFVTSNFWMYWAVTIPLTLAVLTVWKLWITWSYHRGVAKEEEGPLLSNGKTLAVQNLDETTNLALNTPYYPGKGPTGLSL
jgi:hypothetical protein